MKNLIKSYVKNEDAIDEFVIKILMILAGVVIAGLIAWFVYNNISGTAKDTSDALNNKNSNPGTGNEFNGGPFGR